MPRPFEKPTNASKRSLIEHVKDQRLTPITRGLIRLYLAKVLPEEYAPDQAEIAQLLAQVADELRG